MITDKQIELAKKQTKYTLDNTHHEHNDCIHIAYQWLDAQKKTKAVTSKLRPLKHIIEKWGGRYVSTSDVCVAAQIHPDIKGTYPKFNISARLTEPSSRRLDGISESMAHDNHDRYDTSVYKEQE